MFVKVYSYRIRPDKEQEFIAIQEAANRIYSRHVEFRSVHLQNRDDPSRWMEIQWCQDEDAYNNAIRRIDAEPEIGSLWERFQALLDPEDEKVHEEVFIQRLEFESSG